MSIRGILTKPRSKERLLFGVVGVLFLGFSLVQASRSLFGVAVFLAIAGAAAILASATLSERALHRAGIIFILVNVVSAAVALFSE